MNTHKQKNITRERSAHEVYVRQVDFLRRENYIEINVGTGYDNADHGNEWASNASQIKIAHVAMSVKASAGRKQCALE